MEQSSKVVSVTPGGAPAPQGDRLLGAILVRAGRLTAEDAKRILWLQHEKGLMFGEAGVQLGLLSEPDIEFALRQQFNFPVLRRGESALSEALFAAYTTYGTEVEALRALRSQLMLRWFDGPERNTLAIVSGERKEGRSFLAGNLAVMFSLLGARTLLVDADLRNPVQHELFGVENRVGLSAVLSDRAGSEAIQRIPGLPDLSVLPSGIVPPNPLELLAQARFVHMLKELRPQFDIILMDSPAASQCIDSQTISVAAGAALIVARRNRGRMWRVRGVSENVAQAHTIVLGSVLNDF